MSGSTSFGGGQIDIVGLLCALNGSPLQARMQERFTPAGGGPVEERTGRLLVSSVGRVRFDIRQASLPEVTFAYDLPRGMVGGGLSEAPDTWTWSPWRGTDMVNRVLRMPRVSRQEDVPRDGVLVEGIPCRLSEFGDDATTTRQWYAPELGLPLRMETTKRDGTCVLRVYDIRRDEPDPAEWPVWEE